MSRFDNVSTVLYTRKRAARTSLLTINGCTAPHRTATTQRTTNGRDACSLEARRERRSRLPAFAAFLLFPPTHTHHDNSTQYYIWRRHGVAREPNPSTPRLKPPPTTTPQNLYRRLARYGGREREYLRLTATDYHFTRPPNALCDQATLRAIRCYGTRASNAEVSSCTRASKLQHADKKKKTRLKHQHTHIMAIQDAPLEGNTNTNTNTNTCRDTTTTERTTGHHTYYAGHSSARTTLYRLFACTEQRSPLTTSTAPWVGWCRGRPS